MLVGVFFAADFFAVRGSLSSEDEDEEDAESSSSVIAEEDFFPFVDVDAAAAAVGFAGVVLGFASATGAFGPAAEVSGFDASTFCFFSGGCVAAAPLAAPLVGVAAVAALGISSSNLRFTDAASAAAVTLAGATSVIAFGSLIAIY